MGFRVEEGGGDSREVLHAHPHEGGLGLTLAMIAARAGSRSGGAVRLPAKGDADLAELALEVGIVGEEDTEGEHRLAYGLAGVGVRGRGWGDRGTG